MLKLSNLMTVGRTESRPRVIENVIELHLHQAERLKWTVYEDKERMRGAAGLNWTPDRCGGADPLIPAATINDRRPARSFYLIDPARLCASAVCPVRTADAALPPYVNYN